MSVAFDTLKFVEKLEAGGFSATQARAAAGAFADDTGEQLASKADIAAARADMKSDFAGVKSDIAAVKAEFAVMAAKLDGFATKDELKAAISEAKSDLVKWIFAQTLLLIGLLMATMRFGH